MLHVLKTEQWDWGVPKSERRPVGVRADHIKGPNVRSPLQEFFFLAAETCQDEKLFHSRGSLHLNGICPKTVLSDAPISVKPKARNQQVAVGGRKARFWARELVKESTIMLTQADD